MRVPVVKDGFMLIPIEHAPQLAAQLRELVEFRQVALDRSNATTQQAEFNAYAFEQAGKL